MGPGATASSSVSVEGGEGTLISPSRTLSSLGAILDISGPKLDSCVILLASWVDLAGEAGIEADTGGGIVNGREYND